MCVQKSKIHTKVLDAARAAKVLTKTELDEKITSLKNAGYHQQSRVTAAQVLDNPLMKADSYKHGHALQYPDGTDIVVSYIESRGGRFDELVYIGGQIILKEIFAEVPTKQMIKRAAKVCKAHGIFFHKEGWEKLNELGYWPVEIRSVKEGTVLPTRNVLMTIRNTHPDFFWLTSFVETLLLRAIWYPTTVATISYHAKKIIWKGLKATCSNPKDHIDFKMADFGARGVSSSESAGIGSCANLAIFKATDTMEGLLIAEAFYNAKIDDETGECPGYSIFASEHSTMCILGPEGEHKQIERMITQCPESMLTAIVLDGFDMMKALEKLKALEPVILESGKTIVVRPDSGDPVDMAVQVIERLFELFGFTYNDKGCKLLPPHIRMIYGDGIDLKTLNLIVNKFVDLDYSIENIAFGQGGGLLQHCDRDWLKFAMKACAARINGQWYDVYKDPITAPGKTSKRGYHETVYNRTTGEYVSVKPLEGIPEGFEEAMETVFIDGYFATPIDFEEVRSGHLKHLI